MPAGCGVCRQSGTGTTETPRRPFPRGSSRPRVHAAPFLSFKGHTSVFSQITRPNILTARSPQTQKPPLGTGKFHHHALKHQKFKNNNNPLAIKVPRLQETPCCFLLGEKGDGGRRASTFPGKSGSPTAKGLPSARPGSCSAGSCHPRSTVSQGHSRLEELDLGLWSVGKSPGLA